MFISVPNAVPLFTLAFWKLNVMFTSSASTLEQIVEEIMITRTSERGTRVIDHDADGSMETKKREGYF